MSKVLSALGGALPDERPLLSLQIVESVAKCPTGYWPVSRTYDEDADAGLLRQSGLFGKKPSHYICLSKSEGMITFVLVLFWNFNVCFMGHTCFFAFLVFFYLQLIKRAV